MIHKENHLKKKIVTLFMGPSQIERELWLCEAKFKYIISVFFD